MNIDPELIEYKIQSLREMHDDWDESALEHISRVEKKMARLMLEDNYYNLDITKELISRCHLEITQCTLKLANDELMDDLTRKLTIEKRRAWKYFLGLISKDFEGEMKKIDAHVQFLLTGE